MTDNNQQNQQELEVQTTETVNVDNTEPAEKKPTGVLRQGGMYSGLKISVRTANILSVIAVALLVAVFVIGIATADGFTVSFDSNGGTDVESFQVEYGVYGEIDAVPTREGYTFDGWFLDESLTTEYDPEGTIESDITLYAKWVAN